MTNVQMILSKTDDGLRVFKHYLGEDITKLFRNPYREDSRPSCKIYYRRDRYVLHDFGSSEWNGDCFDFVAKVCNMDIKTSFVEILNVINDQLSLCLDFNIPNRQVKERPRVSIPSTPKIHGESDNIIRFEATCNSAFSESELSYWSSYGITKEILKKYNVRSIKQCHISSRDNEYTIYSIPDHPMFGYFHSEGKGVKLYNPKNKVRFLYAGERLRPYVFGFDQLPLTGDTVIITGGEKDTMTLASHGYAALCFNSETAAVPEALIDKLSERFSQIVIMYDSDETGKRESEHQEERLRERGYRNVYSCTLPLEGTKKEKDVSDLFRIYPAKKAKETIDQLLCAIKRRQASTRYECQPPKKFGKVQIMGVPQRIEETLGLLGFSKNLSTLPVLRIVRTDLQTGITVKEWKAGCEVIYWQDGYKSIFVGRNNCMFIPPIRLQEPSESKTCFVFASLFDYLAYQEICMNNLAEKAQYPPTNESTVIIAGSSKNYSNLVLEVENYDRIYSVLPNTDADISLFMWLTERKGEAVVDLSHLYSKEENIYSYMRYLKDRNKNETSCL